MLGRTCLLAVVVLQSATPALAQDVEEEPALRRETHSAAGPKANQGGAGETVTRDWHFGPYVRFNAVPLGFFLGFLLDEAPTVFQPGFGATATYRVPEGPSFRVGLGYQSYSVEGPFRASGDPDTDTEWIESDLAIVHATGSMLWNSELSELFAIEYGFGLDLGVVLGSLVRTEARPLPDGGYGKCPGPSFDAYCAAGSAAYDEEGEHYNVADERVPPVVALPMLPQLALRLTPARHFTVKLEAAYGLVQFWFGLSAAYAPEL